MDKQFHVRLINMKNRNQSAVGQASRLSELTWRRHLPHYQLSSGYYFITFSTHDRFLLQPSQKDCVFNAVCFLDGKKYELYAAVVLNDHVHMVINPFESLPKIMHSIKSFTAHEINKILEREGKVWQNESYDRFLRNDDEFLEKLNYIANNPIKANLARQYEDYKWLYMKGWIKDDLYTGETLSFIDRRDACPTDRGSKDILRSYYKFLTILLTKKGGRK